MEQKTVPAENNALAVIEKLRFNELLKQLESSSARKREQAEEDLWAMGPQVIEPLLAHLQCLERRRRRLPLIITLWVAILLLAVCFAPHASWMNGIFGASIGGIFALRRSHKSGTYILSKFDDARAVGLLTDLLNSRDNEMCASARYALIRLLPKLQASDAPLLNAAQRKRLNAVLRSGDRDLTLAILKAWEQVGDADALPLVESLAAGASISLEDFRIEAAARECLPYLKTRVEQLAASQHLLRASSTTTLPTETLLRPATSDGREAAPETLLRAGQV